MRCGIAGSLVAGFRACRVGTSGRAAPRASSLDGVLACSHDQEADGGVLIVGSRLVLNGAFVARLDAGGPAWQMQGVLDSVKFGAAVVPSAGGGFVVAGAGGLVNDGTW